MYLLGLKLFQINIKSVGGVIVRRGSVWTVTLSDMNREMLPRLSFKSEIKPI